MAELASSVEKHRYLLPGIVTHAMRRRQERARQVRCESWVGGTKAQSMASSDAPVSEREIESTQAPRRAWNTLTVDVTAPERGSKRREWPRSPELYKELPTLVTTGNLKLSRGAVARTDWH
ncbi:hypothetical protein K438DRAFT_1753704 [Mycena galopus ATCC 62051]|nr:hypothetical protein K438DRAFT_1753704 [Mycena galopus ATCC 62051]